MGSTANIVGLRPEGRKMCREWSRAGIFIPRLFFALLGNACYNALGLKD